MLFTPGNSFKFAVDNFGATYTAAALGTQLTSGGSAHTKNATPTSILSALAEDVYGLSICFQGGVSSGAARRFLTDIYVDPAGGTSWEATPRIANLAASSSAIVVGATWYYFPLYLKSGTSIGAACQAESATVTQRILIRAIGKPTRPELLVVGTRVRTFGATTASTTGTAYTPGTDSMGANSASLGTTADDIFWWQFGYMTTDTAQVAHCQMTDVLVGDGTDNQIVMENVLQMVTGTAEQSGCPGGFGSRWPQAFIPSGANIYIRGASVSAPDSSVSGIVYGVTQ